MDKNYSILQNEIQTAVAGSTPLHMPGHKRRAAPCPGLPYAWDVTETPATDDLHAAAGMLAAAMARSSALWGAKRTWYLVNGSTVGLLAGLRALTLGRAGPVVAARNCHKAVYHALELCGSAVRWLVPAWDSAFGICGSVTPAQVAAALDAAPDAACVVITSPSYEGVVSDVAGIAAVCHARGVPLFVDEAHGAHYLPLAAELGWRGGAVAAGADLVVQSAHKTLPSLTQTALLHLNGGRVAPAAVERQLDVFETSSPSYPLLAALDACTGWLAAEGRAAFAAWAARLARFDAAAEGFKSIRALCHGADTSQRHPAFFGFDPGKILLDIGPAGAAYLRAQGFAPEMVCGPNVLAMTSPCDAEDTLDRLAAALLALDAQHTAAPALPPLPAPGECVCTLAAAAAAPTETVPMAAAAGRAAGEYLWAYPPGVPLLAPGERVTPGLLAAAAACTAAGTPLRHSAGTAADMLCVLA